MGRLLRLPATCALAFLTAGAAAAAPPSWASLQALETLSEDARWTVERAAGARFEEAPIVRLASPDRTRGALALYVTDPVAVFLAPELAEAEATRLDLPTTEASAVAWAAVTCEFARALDVQRRAIARLRDRMPDVPSHEAWSHVGRLRKELVRRPPADLDPDETKEAVWAGHSLLVAEEAGRGLGIEDVVERWERRPDLDAARRVRDLLRDLGRVNGRLAIEEALVDPPASIEGLAPAAYSSRYDAATARLDAVLEPLRRLAPKDARLRRDSVRRSGLVHQAAHAGVQDSRRALEGYVSGRFFVAGDGAAAWNVAAAALLWRSPEAAAGFVRLQRAAYERADRPRRSWRFPDPLPASAYRDRPCGFEAGWAKGDWGSGPARIRTLVCAAGAITIEAAVLDREPDPGDVFAAAVDEARALASRPGAAAPAAPLVARPPPEPTVIAPWGTDPWPLELDLPRLAALGIRAAQDVRVVQIRVLDWRAEPVVDVPVSLDESDVAPARGVWPSWHYREARTDPVGVARFWIASGWDNHEVLVPLVSGREDVGDALVGTWWRPEDCTLTLPHTFVVRGTARDARGMPTSARIETRDPNGVLGQWAYTDPDGTFAVRLPYGRVELVARPSEAPSADWPATGAGAASPEHPSVELVIRPTEPDPPPK